MRAAKYDDLREPCLRQHEEAMEEGSDRLLRALWKHHPRIVSERTGKVFGP